MGWTKSQNPCKFWEAKVIEQYWATPSLCHKLSIKSSCAGQPSCFLCLCLFFPSTPSIHRAGLIKIHTTLKVFPLNFFGGCVDRQQNTSDFMLRPLVVHALSAVLFSTHCRYLAWLNGRAAFLNEVYLDQNFACNINHRNLSQEGLNHLGHTASISNQIYHCMTQTQP